MGAGVAKKSGGGGRRGRRRGNSAAMGDINITPFVDVMLVLLIIFMVAAPLSTVDVPVTLPQAGMPAAARPEAPLIVTLQADLALSFGTAPVRREDLAATLQAATAAASGGQDDPRIYLRADQSVAYGDLMALMQLIRDAGFAQVALMAEDRAP